MPRRKISSFNYHRTHTHMDEARAETIVLLVGMSVQATEGEKGRQMLSARRQAYFQSERRWSQATGDQFRRAVPWNAERRIRALAVLGKKD